MTKSACMFSAPLTKLLLKTVGPFKIMFVELDTVTLDKNWIHSRVSGDRVVLANGNTRCNDRADVINDTSDANYCTNADGNDQIVHA